MDVTGDTAATKPNILVVDDTPANLQLMTQMLTQQGYRVRLAPSGPLALQSINSNPPDLILLDINMPEMSGYEVCRHIKTHEQWRSIPIIFISALGEVTEKIKAFRAGGLDYITKPFQFEEVEARVATHLSLSQYQNRLEKMVNEKIQEIYESHMATIHAMAKLCESRDDDTGCHLERVRHTCKLIAEELERNSLYRETIDKKFIQNIYYASVLHDIGKICIPDNILLKTGKLTPEEFEIMKEHAAIGVKTLESVFNAYPHNDFVKMGIIIARSHHEKWDGSGYPQGLAGEDIPLAARIVALADVYDALRSNRCYKEAFSSYMSREIIFDNKGYHFDPVIVTAFINIEPKIVEIYDQWQMADA